MNKALFYVVWGTLTLPCIAAETFTDTVHFKRGRVLWDAKTRCSADQSSLEWAHSLDGIGDEIEITRATLSIQRRGGRGPGARGRGPRNVSWDMAYDGGYGQAEVFLGGEPIGQLQGDVTTFDVPPSQVDSVLSAQTAVSLQNNTSSDHSRFPGFGRRNAAWLKSSTLEIVYENAPVAVPAPSALILAGVGTMVVGALRHRKVK